MMPFAGGLTATPNGLLIFAAAAAMLYAAMVEQKPNLKRTLVKVMVPVLLCGVALAVGGPAALIAALVFSAIGDAFLTQDGDGAFLAGLAAFFAAHLAYIVQFSGIFDLALLTGTPWRIAAGVVFAVMALGLLALLWSAVGAKLRWPVGAYTLLILLMGLVSLGTPGFGLAAGAAVFMASDSLLAIEKFLMPEGSQASRSYGALMRQAVWALYVISQMTLTLAILS